MDDAIGCLERARIEYSTVASEPKAGLDQARHLALGVVLEQALLWREESYEADDLDAELILEARRLAESLGPPTEAAALATTDLEHPAWRLTVAEQALTIPSGSTG